MDALQIIWFILVVVLITAFYLTSGFDFGAGILIPFLKNRAQKDFVVRSILPFWDANQVWLITAGGGLFAAFPKAYSTVLSHLYTPVMLLLMLMIFRVAAIEFYFLKETDASRRFWGGLIALSSLLCAAVFAVALAAVFSGQAMVQSASPLGSIGGLFSPYGCLSGVLGIAFFCAHGAGFMALKAKSTEFAEIFGRLARKAYGFLPLAYILYFSVLLAQLSVHSLLTVALGVLLIVPVLAFLWARAEHPQAAFIAGAAFALGFFCLQAAAMFPYLVAPTSTHEGLTIAQAASSTLTLQIMLGVALVGVPLAIGYNLYAHRVFLRHKD